MAKKVLLADKNGVWREHSKIIRQAVGNTPAHTSNPDRARISLRSKDISILLLNQDMPESILVALTAHSCKVPIAITYSTEPRREDFDRYNPIAYIPKDDHDSIVKTVSLYEAGLKQGGN